MPFLGISGGKSPTPPKYELCSTTEREPKPLSIYKKTIGEDFCYLV